jgi:predicted DNA-binding transcriptional regulator AlpA
MNSVDLSIEKINEKELMELIEKENVDLAVLKSKKMATIENLNFLFLLDSIKASELISYWDMSRATVYRKIMKDYGFKIAKIREIDRNYKTIKLNPKDIFDNIYDYEEFLKWRTAKTEIEKKTVLIKDVVEITGLTRKQIIKLIKKDKLVAIKKKSGTYEILKSSLTLYLLDYLINEKKRMEKAVEYLNINGNKVSLNIHLS